MNGTSMHGKLTVLLCRAQFDTTGGHDFSTPIDVPTVTIPKSDHDHLLSSARQYGMHMLYNILSLW